MSSNDPNKPVTPVVFTELEAVSNGKMTALIQANFLKNHVEITSAANSDLAGMIRDEKMMYSNLAIAYAVLFIAAESKRKTQ